MARFGRKGPVVHTGRLRHRVTVHKPPESVAADAYGQPVESSTEVGSYWADVLPIRSTEGPSTAGDRLAGEVTHLVTIRYGVVIGIGDWIAWRGVRLDVVGPPRDLEGRSRRVEVPCLEYQSADSITSLDIEGE